MEFTEEWKAFWPVMDVYAAPLLHKPWAGNLSRSPLHQLLFVPNHKIPITELLESTSLCPRIPPPYPHLTVSRFLQISDAIPSSIAGHLSLEVPDHSHNFNCIQLLRVPVYDLVIVFFPIGDNYNEVGFTLLSLKDGHLSIKLKKKFFSVKKDENFRYHRIARLLVSPLDEDICGSVNGAKKFAVGFLMVCTEYSVQWYVIELVISGGTEFSVNLNDIVCGSTKFFRGRAISNACWSPHMSEECLVLLKDGDLVLCRIDESNTKQGVPGFSAGAKTKIVKKKLFISVNKMVSLENKNGNWFGCEFSWNPRIFIVAHSNAVFLVDWRFEEGYDVSCLAKISMLSTMVNDRFMAFSRAGPDGFCFTIASKHLLLLCDVRKPFKPLLKWAHKIDNPHYATSFRLSELGSNLKDDGYKLESGYCILLGSFWDCEFNIFCYGPCTNHGNSVLARASRSCSSYCAWGLPSELSLLGSDCDCGSCFIRYEFLKDDLPDWIDWRQKKEVVLGFGILDVDLSAQSSNSSGRWLIRLMSSGKLEAQQYCAIWDPERSPSAHGSMKFTLEDNLLYDMEDGKYELEKKLQHLNFDYLNAYGKDKLARLLSERKEKRKLQSKGILEKHPADSNYHEVICQKLKALGVPRSRSSLTVSDVLKDTAFPTSIHEVALRCLWASLPRKLLWLAFSTYLEFPENPKNHKEPLEFLEIPDQLQAVPFPLRKPSMRSNKWSGKVCPSEGPVGPVLPPHFLFTLNKLCMEETKEERELHLEKTDAFSAEAQIKLQSDKVLRAVEDINNSVHTDYAVSLGDDTNEMNYETPKLKVYFHKPTAFLESSSPQKLTCQPPNDFGCENDRYSTFVFRRNTELGYDISTEMVASQLFDVGCPVELKFHDLSIDFGPKELDAFRVLKKRDLDFQKGLKLYQDYISDL